MNLTMFISLAFAFQLLYWFIGRRSSSNLKEQGDYFLAGKNVKLFPLMMTFFATQVGGGVVLGAAEEAYLYGWPVLLYPMGAALGLIALGCGIGRRLAEFKVSTIAEVLEVVYKSPLLKKIASILSVFSLFMILVAQIVASQKFLTSLGFCNPSLFILFWAIIVFYTVQGGLKAVISTDMAQATVFSIIFLFCVTFVFFKTPLAPEISIESLSILPSKFSGWLLMPLLFMVIEQDMGQRCFAGASPRIVSKASLLAGFCTMIVCIVPVFFGTLAKKLGFEIPAGSSVLMVTIAKTTTPLITALVGCAVLAAIISTATSLINAISSNISNDFDLNFFKQLAPVRFAKITTCFISIAAIFCAFHFDNILGLLIQSYELSVSCLFAPIFIGLFKKKGNLLSAFLAVAFGSISFLLFRILPITFPKEIVSVLFSLSGFGLGETITLIRKKTHQKLF